MATKNVTCAANQASSAIAIDLSRLEAAVSFVAAIISGTGSYSIQVSNDPYTGSGQSVVAQGAPEYPTNWVSDPNNSALSGGAAGTLLLTTQWVRVLSAGPVVNLAIAQSNVMLRSN